MSEINCLSYFYCFSISDKFYKEIKEENCGYICQAVATTAEGIKKTSHAVWFVTSQIINAIAIALLNASTNLVLLGFKINFNLLDYKFTIDLTNFIKIFPPANTIFPTTLLKTIHATVTVPTVKLTEFLTSQLPLLDITFSYRKHTTINFSKYLAAAFSEEFIFRGIIQQVFLRQIPKMILKKLAPAYAETIDYKVARIARVIFTAAIFALAHAEAFGDSAGMLLPQLIGGIIYSSLVERGHSLWKLSLVHCVYNLSLIILISSK